MLPPCFCALAGTADNASAKSRHKKYSRKRARTDRRFHVMLPPMCRSSGIPDRR